jgi:formylglycine-generating enzyme required for sulfatase activity
MNPGVRHLMGTTFHWLGVGLLVIVAAVCIPACGGEKYALVVGVETYIPTELPSLEYAEDDADGIGRALESLGFSVITMTTTSDNPRHQSTTAARILEQVEKRLEDREKGDIVVLAFLGHGVQFKGDKEFYFCPGAAELKNRASLVPMGRVLEAVGRCGAGRKFLLVDACRDELSPEAAGKGVAIELDPAGVFRAEPPTGTIALFSCQPKEKSYELKKFGHSVFTHHVIEYLTGRAGPDRYPRQEVSVEELVPYVQNQTRESVDKLLGARQKPEPLAPDGRIPDWPLGTLGSLASVESSPAVPGPPRPAAGPRAGEVVENSVGMKLVAIPAGDFEMGSNESRKSVHHEKPLHRVRITKPFLMGQTEVTQSQYERVMGKTPWRGKQRVKDGATVAVSYVNWDDATEFCHRLTETEQRAGRLPAGKIYRLPTEAEWEYACRGGTKTKWSFGDDAGQLGDHAWFVANAAEIGEGFNHEVGQKKPNPWGLFDMYGNAWEWCGDLFAEDYYGNSPEADPTGPASDGSFRAPTGRASEGSFRVTRGGSWNYGPDACRSAFRLYAPQTRRHSYFGFRVVCELE